MSQCLLPSSFHCSKAELHWQAEELIQNRHHGIPYTAQSLSLCTSLGLADKSMPSYQLTTSTPFYDTPRWLLQSCPQSLHTSQQQQHHCFGLGLKQQPSEWRCCSMLSFHSTAQSPGLIRTCPVSILHLWLCPEWTQQASHPWLSDFWHYDSECCGFHSSKLLDDACK